MEVAIDSCSEKRYSKNLGQILKKTLEEFFFCKVASKEPVNLPTN